MRSAIDRLRLRRQFSLSASDRFWIALGSVAGIFLVPAAGVALFPVADRPLPGRSSSENEGDTNKTIEPPTAASGVDAAFDTAHQTGGEQYNLQGGLLAGTLSDGYGLPTAENAAATAPSALATRSGSGSSYDGNSTAIGMDLDIRLHAALQSIVPVTSLANSLAPIGNEPAGGEPTLATVRSFDSDPDTWGFYADYMIVSRPQDHMVETADGLLHMVINRGLDLGLTLISSRDDGETWETILTFGPGNPLSTSDIRLLDGQDVMIVSYLNAANNVAFAMFGYDMLTGSWTRLHDTVVDRRLETPDSVHPTVALSPDGTLLLAYADEVDGGLQIILQQSLDGGRTWAEAVLHQPGVDVGTVRVITFQNTDGMIYSNHEAVYWVTWDDRGDWHLQMIDDAGSLGQFASHFSTLTYGDDLVVANAGQDRSLSILRYDDATGIWAEPVAPLAPGIKISNVQISISDDTGYLYVVYDDASRPGNLVVIESRDGGTTWETEALLQTPLDMVSPPARFEAPEHFSGDLVVTQQVFTPEGSEGLYVHTVDVDGPEQAWGDVSPLPTDEFLF